MGTNANPLDDPPDAAALAGYAADLLAAVDVAFPVWIARVVADRGTDGGAAAERATAEAVPALRALLETDVDEQRTNPLSILRHATRHATEALTAAGVPAVSRDEHAIRIFPDDLYDLGPAAFADLGPAVHEAGIVWGAAKAHVILARRRRS